MLMIVFMESQEIFCTSLSQVIKTQETEKMLLCRWPTVPCSLQRKDFSQFQHEDVAEEQSEDMLTFVACWLCKRRVAGPFPHLEGES